MCRKEFPDTDRLQKTTTMFSLQRKLMHRTNKKVTRKPSNN